MRLVVVSAGLSVPSSTRLLGDRLAAATAERTDAEVQVVELRDLAVEIAHHLTNGFPGPRLSSALEGVTAADGLIVVTPVFSASYSGLFKSFFDVLDRDALAGKPVLVAATGGTARHSLVLEHALRPLFAYLRAVVVPTAVYAASEDWGAEGLAGRVERAAGELAGLMGGLRGGASESVSESASESEPTSASASESELTSASSPESVIRRTTGAALPDVVPFAQRLAALSPSRGA
ncbi:CE1759 family FMN reductase [Streptomyces bluensis]|uniref:CE1759 family FMN reductase n=1 Tax=Streptomyces bluensis TaxID=33897 RepID=UPI003328C4D0